MERKRKYNGWYALIAEVPRIGGVYEVWSGDKVLYVGQGRCMYSRLYNHGRRSEFLELGADKIRWTAVADSFGRLSLESALTFEFRPKMLKRKKVWPCIWAPNWVEEFGYVAPDGYTVRTSAMEFPNGLLNIAKRVDYLWNKYTPKDEVAA